jgi:hypothetical protein
MASFLSIFCLQITENLTTQPTTHNNMATDKNKHLDDVLTSHKISKEEALRDKHIKRRDEVVTDLKSKYGTDLFDPFNSGSYAKHTAVNKKFDFDLIAPFKRNAFDTLESMYNSVFDFLNEKYKDKARIVKQKVSIGLIFHRDTDGHEVKIDVVPGRELNKNTYPDIADLNLYVYEQFGQFAGGSDRIKSNIKLQIANVKQNADRDSIRQIIRLLKVWKIYNSKTPKSFLIELITIKAFDKKDVKGDLWEKLKIVMEFIRDNVKTLCLPDPGNASNDVAETLNDSEKAGFSDDMKHMIERIEADSDMIKTYFQINPKFPADSGDKSSYGLGTAAASIPPAVRFG